MCCQTDLALFYYKIVVLRILRLPTAAGMLLAVSLLSTVIFGIELSCTVARLLLCGYQKSLGDITFVPLFTLGQHLILTWLSSQGVLWCLQGAPETNRSEEGAAASPSKGPAAVEHSEPVRRPRAGSPAINGHAAPSIGPSTAPQSPDPSTPAKEVGSMLPTWLLPRKCNCFHLNGLLIWKNLQRTCLQCVLDS